MGHTKLGSLTFQNPKALEQQMPSALSGIPTVIESSEIFRMLLSIGRSIGLEIVDADEGAMTQQQPTVNVTGQLSSRLAPRVGCLAINPTFDDANLL
jgi:hypothetical protein